jgi:two-component system, NtrC family, sensor kinase
MQQDSQIELKAKLARSERELSEAREQQAATAEVLKIISRSAFDLQIVFETLVVSAARLCRADKANIARFDGEKFQYAASVGFPPNTWTT